ncbi:MAG: hypothetical protein KF901_13895 [Myxococcales bacterium]|nr:hypothetical protein [Myxococcales bacterium]
MDRDEEERRGLTRRELLQWEVLVGPAAQISNPLFTNCRPPQFSFSSGRNNYTELAFDPTSGEITLRWIDGDGVAFATETIRP